MPLRSSAALRLRLLAVLLLIVAVASGSIALVAGAAIERTRERQQAQTRNYLSARIASLDEAWRNTAYATRQKLDLWQAGRPETTTAARDASLRTLLVTLADQGDFTHATLLGEGGQVRLRYGTRSQDAPRLPDASDAGGLGWVYSAADRTVYRTVTGVMGYGAEQGQLVLHFPIDNALLARLAFPGTRLSLLHGGTDVARSDAGAPIASAPAETTLAPQTLPWGSQAGAPSLRIHQQFPAPLSPTQLVLFALAAASAFAVGGWLVLGRWVRSQSERLHELQSAATEFAAASVVTSTLEARLDAAVGVPDDITQLAGDLRRMMKGIEQARAEQARSAEALAALNATLESRVVERTRELEAARDEALAASRAKEKFLSNMSHEIRTPMNGMLGALELMSKTPLSPRQAEYIEVAGASGEALLAIINEVLDFAKIHAGHLQLAREPIDVNAVAHSVTTLFAASAQRKSIALRLEADPGLKGLHLGDGMRLRQVLMNLTGNAIKFTQRGEIVLRTRWMRDGGGGRIAFEVSDTGTGIEASQQALIFEPFVQAEGAARRAPGGTGLGLSISRQLVQAMGGELKLESRIGEGSTFSFELGLEPAAAPEPPSQPGPLEGGPPAPLQGRVLLVEDNSVNRLIATAMLESMGLEVVPAEDGQQALALLAQHAVSLVLMDCQMPVMDGFEATQRIREAERQSGRPRLPVIALTANALVGDIDRCLGAGMDAHLGKPFSMRQLRQLITPWLGTAHPTPPT